MGEFRIWHNEYLDEVQSSRKYFSGNEIKKEKMARACGLHGGEEHKVIWWEILKE